MSAPLSKQWVVFCIEPLCPNIIVLGRKLWYLVVVLLFTSLNAISWRPWWFGSLSFGYSAGLFFIHFTLQGLFSPLFYCFIFFGVNEAYSLWTWNHVLQINGLDMWPGRGSPPQICVRILQKVSCKLDQIWLCIGKITFEKDKIT